MNLVHFSNISLSLNGTAGTMIDYLANPNKQRLKPDGTNISAWLQGLSLFAGAVCKKYPEMEIVGILSYISSQLRNGNSLDLVVLKELVQKMSGIETLEDMSEVQHEALAGGETLRQEVLFFFLSRFLVSSLFPWVLFLFFFFFCHREGASTRRKM